MIKIECLCVDPYVTIQNHLMRLKWVKICFNLQFVWGDPVPVWEELNTRRHVLFLMKSFVIIIEAIDPKSESLG